MLLKKSVKFVIRYLVWSSIALLLILLLNLTLARIITGQMEQTSNLTKNLDHLTKQNIKEGTKIKLLNQITSEQQKKLTIKTREDYYNDLSIKIEVYYNGMVNFRSKDHYLIGVRAAFFASERLFEKKAVKYYAKTQRECALKLLATAKNESDFTYDKIGQNYEKDEKGLYKTIYGYKIKEKKGFEYALIKTTKDYGWLQCNDIHIKDGVKTDNKYRTLRNLGLWDAKENRWILEPEVNAMIRILVDDERIRMGWNTPDNCNFNKNFLKMLQGVKYE